MTETVKLKGMNVILFITDQERAIQHFPPDWAKQNLPGQTQLKQNGLTFPRAFCAACMCSPSRSSMMTGYFPAQTGVKWTLEQTMQGPKYPQQVLPIDLPNLATVMAAAGYATPYKGKFHLTKYPEKAEGFVPHDVNKYGFQRWDPQDAGANQDPSEFGGGNADNDGRFMNSTGSVEEGEEGVIAYLQSDAAKQGPFFLVVSLVNPHDVLAYPKETEDNGYSDPSWFKGDIGLPATVHEDLSTKPRVQEEFLKLSAVGLGPLVTPQKKLNYLNFYGNLMILADRYLVQMLQTLETEGLLENTLIIRTSDHGEMGLAAMAEFAAEEFQFLRRVSARAADLLQPQALSQTRGVAGHDLARGSFAHTGQSVRRPGLGARQLAGSGLLRSGPQPGGGTAPAVRGLHL